LLASQLQRVVRWFARVHWPTAERRAPGPPSCAVTRLSRNDAGFVLILSETACKIGGLAASGSAGPA
jgi:hypothetical protein